MTLPQGQDTNARELLRANARSHLAMGRVGDDSVYDSPGGGLMEVGRCIVLGTCFSLSRGEKNETTLDF